jgi:NADH:ubiquinone oxidoreductase subunit H
MISFSLIFFIIYVVVNWPLAFSIFYFWVAFFFMFLQVLFFTTAERKILALTQRRVGPKVMGTRGRLQYFADALKILIKLAISPRNVHSIFFYGAAMGTF